MPGLRGERAAEADHERLPEEVCERLHPPHAEGLVEAVLSIGVV
jgi:hypothetical protein